MKRFAIVSLLSLCAAGAYAQGTLTFYNSFSDLDFQIYAPNTAAGQTAVQLQGDTASQLATSGLSGTPVVYPGVAIGGQSDPSPSTVIPGNTPAFDAGLNYHYGNDFTAEVYALSAGNGSGAMPAFSSLLPVSQYTEQFATTAIGGANLNQVNPPSDPGIPGTGYDGSGLHSANGIHIINNAWVAVVAWYNAGGSVTSLAQAQAANVPWGESAIVQINGLGEPASVENSGLGGNHTPTQPTEMYGMQSFDLTYQSVPEPATIALGLMAVCGFLARRRKA